MNRRGFFRRALFAVAAAPVLAFSKPEPVRLAKLPPPSGPFLVFGGSNGLYWFDPVACTVHAVDTWDGAVLYGPPEPRKGVIERQVRHDAGHHEPRGLVGGDGRVGESQ